MAYPMFIFSIVLIHILIISIDATSNFMKASDSTGKSFPDGLGVVSPGQSITMECNHKNSISWTRRDLENTKVEPLISNGHIVIEENKLTINNINFSDASVYYCEQSGVVYVFYLNVYAITKTQNGRVSLSAIPFDMNGIQFNQMKINDKISANVSCTCDSGSVKTTVVIDWKGGSYSKISDEYTIEARKDGSAQTNTLILRKPLNNPQLYGEYTCLCNALTGAVKDEKVYLEVPPIFDEYESSVRTTEGQNLTLTCNVWGYPAVTSAIQWRFQNSTELRIGIQILHNQLNPGHSQLFIPAATQDDRGVYTCHAENSVGTNTAGKMIRVKGRYAALWPFIGIIIQVIILAAIIIIYEWKKSHKPQENTTNKFNVDSKNEREPGVAIRSGGEQTDIRQRLMVH